METFPSFRHWRPFVGQAIPLTVLVAASFGLGALGFHEHWIRDQIEHTPLDSMYASLQLFVFEQAVGPGPKPWILEVARFLSPALTVTALILTVTAVLRRKVGLLLARNHVVVCGLGDRGLALARKHLEGKARKRVVIVDTNKENPSVETCREMGAIVLFEDARDRDVLRRCRIDRAEAIYAVCRDDATNAEIAFRASDLHGRSAPPLKCYVHSTEVDLLPEHSEAFESIPFSVYGNAARLVLDQHPLAKDGLGPDSEQHVHLVILGFGRMGEALAIQAAKIGHYANREKAGRTRISVVDSRAAEREIRFRARYPQIDRVVDIDFMETDAESPAVRERVAGIASDPLAVATFAVCVEKPSLALAFALNLPREVHERGCQVLIRLVREKRDSSFSKALLAVSKNDNVHLFGSVEEGCDLDSAIDDVGMGLHNDYFQKRFKADRRDGEDENQYRQRMAAEPALKTWQCLGYEYKDSNRQQADHFKVKVRELGMEMVGEVEAAAGMERFSEAEIEILARMEHDRWCADKHLKGWRFGPKDDKQNKVSSCLVPWEELSPEMRERDREPMRESLELWKKANYRIVKRARP